MKGFMTGTMPQQLRRPRNGDVMRLGEGQATDRFTMFLAAFVAH